MIHDNERLKELQSLPLERKIGITQSRIIERYNYFNGNVYVSFSGGKDSTVLYDIVHKLFPDVPAVFSNTGLEYPEIQNFAKNICSDIVKPNISFLEVIKQNGYPLISKEVSEAIYYARRNKEKKQQLKSEQNFLAKENTRNPQNNARRKMLMGSFRSSDGLKKSSFNKEKWLPVVYLPFKISHYCCNIMKKSPLQKYYTKTKRTPYIGTMAEESRIRKQAWIRHGCNAFGSTKKTSQPLSFWTEQDILQYIKTFNLDVCSVYGEIETLKNGKLHFTGCQRTGCIWCPFGSHLEKGSDRRFLRLKETHPELYDYCMRGGHWEDNPDYILDLPNEPDEMGWIPWNP